MILSRYIVRISQTSKPESEITGCCLAQRDDTLAVYANHLQLKQLSKGHSEKRHQERQAKFLISLTIKQQERNQNNAE